MDIPKLLRDVDADFRNIKTGLTPLNSCSSGGFFSDLSTPTLFMTPTTNQDGQFFSNLDSLTISKGNAVNNSHNGSNNVSQPNAPKLEVSPSGNLYSKRQSGASLDEGQIAQFMSTTTAMNNGGGGTITYDHTPASSSISDTSGPNHPTQSTMPMAVSVGSSHKVKSKKQRTSAGSQLSSSTNGHSQQCASEKKFQCSHVECSKTFARSDELKRHQRTHNNMRPYVCSYCDKCFTRSDHLRTHVRTHTGEKPFPCDKCGRRFARSDERSRHQKTHERSSGHSRVSAEGGKKKSSTAGKQQRVDTFASPAAVSGMVQKMDSENAPALMTTTHTMQQQQHHHPHSTLPLSLPLHPHHNHHHHAPHHSVLHPHRLSSIVHTNTPSHDCAHVT